MGNTPIIGKHTGTKEAIRMYADRNAKRKDQVLLFIDELFAQNIMDGFMIAVQSAHETGRPGWNSPIWQSRLNPAGIGVTDGGDQGISYKDGRDAARAMLIHHCAYTGMTVPEAWKSWLPLDPRYQIAKDAFGGTVNTWADYGDGRWATDPQYYEKILDMEQEIREYEVPGEKPGGFMPNIIDKWLHVAQDGYPAVNRRYIGRQGMQPEIIVVHIQEGYNQGSWQHFHQVTASSTVLIGKNGDIWRLVPESDSPWTNGDVKSPTAKGREVINQFGPDPNVYALTIETEGFTGEWPKPQAQLNSVLWQIRTWMQKYTIPVSLVVRHADFNQVDRPYCPGNPYYSWLLEQIGSSGPIDIPTEYAKPEPVLVNGEPWDGKSDVTVSGTLFHANTRNVKTAADGVRVRKYANTSSAELREPLKSDEAFDVLGWVEGEEVESEKRWWISKYFSRIWTGGTIEKPETQPTGDDEAEKPEGVRIYKGKVYYELRTDGEIGREFRVTSNAHLRKDASTKSESLGKVKEGDIIKAVLWTVGETVKGERLWLILDPGPGKGPIKSGPRLWIGATVSRPD